MKVYTTTALVRNVTDVTRAATMAPVALAQHRKARFVMLNADLYEEMVTALDGLPGKSLPHVPKDLRRAMAVDDMPAELAEEVRAAIVAYQDDEAP